LSKVGPRIGIVKNSYGSAKLGFPVLAVSVFTVRQGKDMLFLPCRLTAEQRCDSEGCNKQDQPALEQQQPTQPLDYQACLVQYMIFLSFICIIDSVDYLPCFVSGFIWVCGTDSKYG
jgi:hypothetical protein